MMKSITVMSLCSSFGDFQTYLALSLTLASLGYEVRLLAPKKFELMAKDFNVTFVSVSDYGLSRNCYLQQEQEEDHSSRENDGESSTSFENGCSVETLDAKQLTTTNFLTEIQNHTPDLLIEGTMCEYYGLYAKHVLKILSIKIKLQEESLSIHNPTFSSVSEKRSSQLFMSVYDHWVQYEDAIMFGLCSKRLCDVYSKEDFITDSICGGESDHIVICQSILCRVIDPVRDIAFVGPLIIEDDVLSLSSPCNPRGRSRKQIEAFINDYPERKPICFCWDHTIHGSYLLDPIVKFITSLSAMKERGVIIGDHGICTTKEILETYGLTSYTAKNVLFITERQYFREDLFSSMKCVIHQGDSDTTDSVLLSGTPSIIIPTFPEQLSNSHAISRLGVGCGMSVHFDQVTTSVFGDLIKAVVDDVKMKLRASSIAEKIRQENGNKAVVDKIKCFWENNKDFVEAQHYKYILKRSLGFLVLK